MSRTIYMDHMSTTPCDPRVVEAMQPYFTQEFGNPSSHLYGLGNRALAAVDAARAEVARLVEAEPEQVVFTSGATEANNLAVIGLAREAMAQSGRKRVLISNVEHYSVLNAANALIRQGFYVEVLPVDHEGLIRPETLKKALNGDTALVSVVHASGEIGTIEPVAELAALAHQAGALFHTDATQTTGLIEVKLNAWGLDAVTLSAHNFYGPKGAGALILGKHLRPEPISFGGWQEGGLRSGTENVPAIVGMGAAAKLLREEREERARHMQNLGERLWQGLAQSVRFIRQTGHPTQRLPGHVSFWVEHVEGESLVLFLAAKGVCASSGSACASNFKAKDEHELVASHVLAAVGVPTDICAGSVCLTLGTGNTDDDVDVVLREFPAIVERLLSMSPSYADLLKNQGAKR